MKMEGEVKPNRSKTGVPGLDDILNGGLIPHRIYLLDGDPGRKDDAIAPVPD